MAPGCIGSQCSTKRGCATSSAAFSRRTVPAESFEATAIGESVREDGERRQPEAEEEVLGREDDGHGRALGERRVLPVGEGQDRDLGALREGRRVDGLPAERRAADDHEEISRSEVRHLVGEVGRDGGDAGKARLREVERQDLAHHVGDPASEQDPVPRAHQELGRGLERGVVQRLEQAVQVVLVAAHHFREGPERVRGRLEDLQRVPFRTDLARLSQSVAEVAESLVAEPLREPHDGADAHVGPFGHRLDSPERAEERVGHQGVGDPAHRLGELVVDVFEADLDVRGRVVG